MQKKLTDRIISAAIDGFQAQKVRLDQQIAELRAMLPGGSVQPVTTPESARARRRFSPAARRRMREAQRQRWAKIRSETAGTPQRVTKPKRRISAQGLKNIIAATKRQWALKRLEAAKERKVTSSQKKAVAKRTARKKAA